MKTAQKNINLDDKWMGIPVNSVWLCWIDYVGHDGFDVAAYLLSGFFIWPCGKCFDRSENPKHCNCRTCKKVKSKRHLIENLNL